MQIIREHGKNKEEAISTIDKFLDGLMTKPFPGDVELKDSKKTWNGDEMSFSFKAKKGFFEIPISGSILVGEKEVKFNADLPSLVTSFIPEEKIAKTINSQFDSLFG